jgi:hypothetical protein
LPVVGEIRECRQISATCWEGIDAANGALLQVRGAMPEKLRLLAFHQGATLVRDHPADPGSRIITPRGSSSEVLAQSRRRRRCP